MTSVPARRRDANTVFQEYALFPHMTVAQNVEYGLKVKGVARDVYENPANRFVADFVGTSNVLDGTAARALIGRPGTFVVRPERIGVFAPGTDSVFGVQTADATVLEVIYAGPTTKIVAATAQGMTLTAIILTASTWLPPDLQHGSPITLAWPQKAVHQLLVEEQP